MGSRKFGILSPTSCDMISFLEIVMGRSKLLLQKPNPKRVCYINFAVTYMCNGRCEHCNIWQRYKNNPEEVSKELNLDEIKKVFEKSQYLRNLQGIYLTGGEPFLRKDFVELCGFFIEKYPNAEITIPTNAINTKLIMSKLSRISDTYNPKNIYISISLDGIDKTHDEVRGVPGAYDRVLKLIELIKRRVPLIKQGVSFTIMPQNCRDLLNVYKLSKKLEIGFFLQFAQISDVFYENIEKQFEWNEAKLDEINSRISLIMKGYRKEQNVLRRIGGTSAYYLSHMTDFQKNPRMISKCYSGVHSFFMDPYGNIFPCIMLNKKIGNILESEFDEIWLSKKAKEVREFIKEGKCACWTPCERCPSLARDAGIILWNLSRIVNISLLL